MCLETLSAVIDLHTSLQTLEEQHKMLTFIQGAPLADISLQQVLGTPSMAKAAAEFEALPTLALDEVRR